MAGPMRGVRVIEMATWAAIPGCASILADWGADVIKVENPQGGDPYRGYAHSPISQGDTPLTPSFEQKNRNKRSVTLDVATAEGYDALLRLLAGADVFMTNSRPETLQRLGVDYQTLHGMNPRLVGVYLYGYGHKGPDANRPGYDALCFWARSGLAMSLSQTEDEPAGQRPAIGDTTTALALTSGVSAALFERERTGQGRQVIATLYGTALYITGSDMAQVFATGQDVRRVTRRNVGNPMTTSYRASDGKWMLLANMQFDRFWAPLCKAVGRPDLIEHPRFDTGEKRAENAAELVSIFEKVFATKSRDEWMSVLDAEGIRSGKVQTPLEAAGDEQAWASGFFQRIPHPDGGETTYVSSPVQFDGEMSTIKTVSPQLGQHTEEVLLEAGYSWQEIDALRDHEAIL